MIVTFYPEKQDPPREGDLILTLPDNRNIRLKPGKNDILDHLLDDYLVADHLKELFAHDCIKIDGRSARKLRRAKRKEDEAEESVAEEPVEE